MKEKNKNNKGKRQDRELLWEHEPDLVILDEAIEKEYTKTAKQADKDKANQKKPKKAKKRKNAANKEFARVTYFFVALFLVMMGYIVYFNAVKSKDMINSPYNVRLDSMADRVVRGKILDQDGNVLAETRVAEDGTETRNYPYGDLYAHVVGYDSNGKSGLESTENFDLLTSNAFFLEQLKREIQEEKNIGDNIVTTLDTDLQKAAYNALESYKGAVVVMEASTGKILAMVSKPTFDPNTVVEDWDWLTTDEDSSLLNRATQGAYAPGSVFKLVTLLEYIRENSGYDTYTYECDGEIEYDGTTIHCAGNYAHGTETLADSLAYSCNSSFVNIGLSLNIKSFCSTAEGLLFNSKLPNILPYTESKFQLTTKSSTSEIMMTAMGQGKTQVSPYHMTLISAAIANGGNLMKPYLVDQVVNYTGTVISKNMPEKYEKLMTSEEASILKDYMSGVVEYGTGTALKNSTYSVAGKTGTAEYSSDKSKSHSWFTGFSNIENPDIVVTVVVESADQSGKSAVSVAKKIFDTYYY